MRNLFAFCLFCAVLSATACGSPIPVERDASSMDPAADPVQEKAAAERPVTLEKGGWKFVLTPKASYSISGEVVSRENYYTGTCSLISPCDIALVFGELYSSGLYKDIKWSQSGRWYWWSYGESFPKQDNKYIARWSCNNHVVPATGNLWKAARSLGAGDVVVLEGSLVSIDGGKGDETFSWDSSLSRSDTGEGSCEILYLTRMRIGEDVYE